MKLYKLKKMPYTEYLVSTTGDSRLWDPFSAALLIEPNAEVDVLVPAPQAERHAALGRAVADIARHLLPAKTALLPISKELYESGNVWLSAVVDAIAAWMEDGENEKTN